MRFIPRCRPYHIFRRNMLDIKLFREAQGGNPEIVRESQRRRFARVEVVDEVIAADEKWRVSGWEGDQLRKELNSLSKQVGLLKKEKKDAEAAALMEKSKEVKVKIEECEKATEKLAQERDEKLKSIGNIIADTCFISKNEDENPIVRTWGVPKENIPKGMNHVDLLYRIGGVEYQKGVQVAGGRGFFLKGPAVLLNMALIQYGIHFLTEREYTPIQTPYFMEKEAMAKVAQLDDFDEQLYKVSGEGGEKYLIATSEQPICAYHLGEWIEPKELPYKYVGFSTCFRKETGSHGRDTLGIFRVHQFEKLEQFVVCSPEESISWDMMEHMISNAEEFYKTLGIPYRVVNIVSGALNNAAAKKYDLEGWYPASQTYRELVSCSNCTDYQARRLETRFGHKKMGDREKRYVHMLNSTLCATTRVICAILENYQTEDGVHVPEVLQPYMGGKTFFPFVRDAPVLPPVDKAEKADKA
mmetsp:Transcript_10539/g.18112  ORF Transcript_10539/g.18112 Transcript_10539/m.18112 type:complete len:471 (-) Transcript_10539:92-1504(-)